MKSTNWSVLDYPVGFLSAFAEGHRFCPWMNADSAVRSFACRWANATADFDTGRYLAEARACVADNFTSDGRRRVFHGTMGFARGASLLMSNNLFKRRTHNFEMEGDK